MKRFAFYLTVLFITFFFGVITAKIYFVWNVQFEVKAVGSMGMCRDASSDSIGMGGFTFMESYDGEKLAFFHTGFSSEQAAQNCFQLKLQYATRIIEREPLFDKANEKIVGERVVALYNEPSESGVKESATIISLDGDKIYEISSTSLRHALIYDKQARRY